MMRWFHVPLFSRQVRKGTGAVMLLLMMPWLLVVTFKLTDMFSVWVYGAVILAVGFFISRAVWRRSRTW